MGDFSDRLENCTSLSQLDDWLQDLMPDPPRNCASISPAPVLQSISTQSNSRAASPANTRDRSESVPPQKSKINVEYRFYFLQATKTGPSNTRVALKRKSNATDPEAKYKKLVSDAGKIWFDWDVSNDSLIDFKRAAIDAIRRLDNKQFATHAQAKDEEERLGWLVSVPHGGIFAEKNKTMLDDAVFPDFLDQIDGPRDGRIKYTITLVESDPKLIAQKQQAVKFLESQHGEQDDNDEAEPSPGASVSAKVMENIAELKALHMPCERLTGSSELNVFMHPSGDDRFIPLNLDRLALWARTMIDNKEVTKTSPPLSFLYVTKAEYYRRVKGRRMEDDESPVRRNRPRLSSDGLTPTCVATESTPESLNTSMSPNVSLNNSPVVTMNMSGTSPAAIAPFNPMMPGGFMGHPMAWMPPWAYGQHPMMYPGPYQPACFNPNTSSAPAPPAPTSSPVPSDTAVELEDYFRFLRVETSELLYQVLNDFGISHYTGFSLFEAKELVEAGIKKGPARALVNSVKKYERHLKATRQRSE